IEHLHVYVAAVRVKVAGSTSTIRTQVCAEGISQARKLLQYVYGVHNVLAVAPASQVAHGH
ncbi:MAG: hypothetical protein RL300_1627, partial [Pseudomonadota bacterium]